MPVSTEMQALIDTVTAKNTIDDSVVAFVNGLSPLIANAAGDRAASLDLARQVKEKGDAIVAAIQANTPAAP
jgi:hypothetical protein